MFTKQNFLMSALLTSVACLLLLPGEPAFAQDKAFLKVKKIKVQTKNPKGKSWDPFGGAPDPIVYVKQDRAFGRKITVRGIENAFAGTYPTKKQKQFIVSPGDRIRIQVYDEDTDLDDFIGAVTITITKEEIQKGRRVLEKFGRVISLELEFVR